jgi:hypothetical protein
MTGRLDMSGRFDCRFLVRTLVETDLADTTVSVDDVVLTDDALRVEYSHATTDADRLGRETERAVGSLTRAFATVDGPERLKAVARTTTGGPCRWHCEREWCDDLTPRELMKRVIETSERLELTESVADDGGEE